jgi:predicted transposase/invertase (TIGR01784 family)
MNLSVAYLKKKEEWREEGKEEGWQAGKEEGKEEIVMNMLRRGLDIESIRDFTGLPIETIEKLRDRL